MKNNEVVMTAYDKYGFSTPEFQEFMNSVMPDLWKQQVSDMVEQGIKHGYGMKDILSFLATQCEVGSQLTACKMKLEDFNK